MITPTIADIGRKVIYRSEPDLLPEEGVLTSFNEGDDGYVFVRYGSASESCATLRSTLEWTEDSKPVVAETQSESVMHVEPTIVTKTFQCEKDGSSGLTVTIDKNEKFHDPIKISAGKIANRYNEETVYLDRAMIENLYRFITTNGANDRH